MELLNTVTVEEAKNKIREAFGGFSLKQENISILDAVGRYLAKDIIVPIDVPGFDRSTVDGYAVISKDTFGASESVPGFLKYKDQIEMGKKADVTVRTGNCYYVPTGGMLPEGCDSVVMIEYTEVLGNDICIQRPVAPGENVLKKGEDLKRGDIIFKKGHKLRPQDIGMLAGIGTINIDVYEKLRVSIISTGDELVSPTEDLKLGQIKDMNTYSLSAASIEDGCNVIERTIVKDHRDLLKNKIEECVKNSHIVLISGGSSMGNKDFTKDVINDIGSPGVFIHGVSVKPGKPTIVGKIGTTALFGLPGQPVSALVIYKIFVSFLINNIYYNEEVINQYIEGEISVNIPSAPGREHYVMVNIREEIDKTVIEPVYGKSGMLSMMAKARGYVKIKTNQEGLIKGEKVRVFLF
ncbi:molybdopterin molybdotransferase MoeA [Alkaliphilus sp. MSJ-5]|uniref:Molybdopterin molybdenumtransferase n=1 Tax=Alkaliphilus flagellatus TaxID=2841507 RepID=A0ABS6G1T1_9FIRM|nr:gephyrin-like molybdotransferase Glp [Alkaliphilus flagellatus]MBU5675598.1 molybdopterin molybdotransferase MoeA [Alkaliphilus flagellatus]